MYLQPVQSPRLLTAVQPHADIYNATREFASVALRRVNALHSIDHSRIIVVATNATNRIIVVATSYRVAFDYSAAFRCSNACLPRLEIGLAATAAAVQRRAAHRCRRNVAGQVRAFTCCLAPLCCATISAPVAARSCGRKTGRVNVYSH
jgi:hypothetical protein